MAVLWVAESAASEATTTPPMHWSSSTVHVATRTPQLSVVVVFHDRLNFVLDAVNSVLGQAGAENCEVIVVGPRLPPSITQLVESGAVTFEQCAGISLGEKIARGIRSARGRFVAFLEDDDRFNPGKVSAILSTIESDPEVGYYQNGFALIDEAGHPYDGNYYKSKSMERWARRGRLRVGPSREGSDLRCLRGIPFSHNLSSIAIRREILEGKTDLIERVGYPVDLSLFALTMLRSTALSLDPARLTSIRIHSGSLSNPMSAALVDEVERLRASSDLNQPGLREIFNYVKGHGSPEVVPQWEGIASVCELNHLLRVGAHSRKPIGTALIIALSRWWSFGVQSNWEMVLLGMAMLPSPRVGSRAYFGLRRLLTASR